MRKRNQKITDEKKKNTKEALELLRSPDFLNKVIDAVRKAGLVGEERNALVLFVVGASRLMSRPLNAFVKGKSSSGKNWLVKLVLKLFLRRTYFEVTDASEKAWNYVGKDLQHRIVYLQERNERSNAGQHPVRLLISENRLIRIVTERVHGEFFARRHVTKGPIAAISTTTKKTLTIDDENRHVSLWIDTSSEQTRRIMKRYLRKARGLSKREQSIWRCIQELLEERSDTETVIPHWFEIVADQVSCEDVRLRRYFPFFVEACRTICLIRSFGRSLKEPKRLEVDFADFAIAALIFDPILVESLRRGGEQDLETRQVVERLSKKKPEGVSAVDFAAETGMTRHRAYTRLRRAARAGLIRQVNRPEKSNRKLYLPSSFRFLPDPKELFQKVDDADDPVRFVHPFTGKWVVYSRQGLKKRG